MLRIKQEVDRETALISNALNNLDERGISMRSRLPGNNWAKVLEAGGSLSVAVSNTGRIRKGEQSVPFYNQFEAPESALNGNSLMALWDAEFSENRARIADYRQRFQKGFGATESSLTDPGYAQALAEFHGQNGIRSIFSSMNSSHDEVVDPRLNTGTNTLYLLGEIEHISKLIRTQHRDVFSSSFKQVFKKYGMNSLDKWSANSEVFRMTALHGLIALASGVPMTHEQKKVWTFFKELIPGYYSQIISTPWGNSINERVSYLVSAFIREINFAKLHDIVRAMPEQDLVELLVKMRGDISSDPQKLVKSFGAELIYEQIILHIDGLKAISAVRFGSDLPKNDRFKGTDVLNAQVASRYLNLWLVTQKFSSDSIRSWQKEVSNTRADNKLEGLYRSLLGMSAAEQEQLLEVAKLNGLKVVLAPKKVRNSEQLGIDYGAVKKSCKKIAN